MIDRKPILAIFFALCLMSPVCAQVCPGGICPPQTITQPVQDGRTFPAGGVMWLDPLRDAIDLTNDKFTVGNSGEPYDQIVRATCRVTVANTCGTGTVVGIDADGNALCMTNAHVTGTNRQTRINLERWNLDGSSEKGSGQIIAVGYGRGMSVDFAILRCSVGFAKDVTPIPLVDRYPTAGATIVTNGCPRCEWPSAQCVKMNRREGQVLTWNPQANGGRSGSAVCEITPDGPRVVALLTWGGGGEGLGQSTPFLINAMRGRLPASLEAIPSYATPLSDEIEVANVCQVPATISGAACCCPLPVSAIAQQDGVDQDTLGRIIDRPRLKPKPEPEPEPDENRLIRRPNDGNDSRQGPIARLFSITRTMLLLAVAFGIGWAVGRYGPTLSWASRK